MSRVAVVGCGAIGSSTAGALRLADVDLVVVDPWYQHVEAIKATGLQVSTTKGLLTVPVPALHLDEFDLSDELFDIVLLGVKAYDTGWMARIVEPHLSASGYVVSLQNGLNEQRIADVVGPKRTIGCVVLMSADFMGPDQARRTTDPDAETFVIGELDGADSSRLVDLQGILSPAGKTAISTNIWGELWAKLAINCMINALSGITGYSVPQMWADTLASDLMIHICGEVVDVSKAVGVDMEPIRLASSVVDPNRFAAAHRGDAAARSEVMESVSGIAAQAASPNKNQASASLLQDIVRHRRTEVEYLNGLVARFSRDRGISAPYNSVLPGLVRDVESGALEQGPSNLSLVASTVAELQSARER